MRVDNVVGASSIFSHFLFQSFNSWSKLVWAGMSSEKKSFMSATIWSFKDGRDRGNKHNPRTAHLERFWNRSVSSATRWSISGIEMVRLQYSSGEFASTFPRRVWRLHLLGIEIIVSCSMNSKFFNYREYV